MVNHYPCFIHHFCHVSFPSPRLSSIEAHETLCSSFASTIFAPGVPALLEEFHTTNEELASFVVSIYILGFCIGPLILAPLSELYGRSPVMHLSNIFFLIFSMACAVSTNLEMFIVFRLFMGIAGCPPLTLGGGTIADLMPPVERGKAMSIWSMGPLLVSPPSTAIPPLRSTLQI